MKRLFDPLTVDPIRGIFQMFRVLSLAICGLLCSVSSLPVLADSEQAAESAQQLLGRMSRAAQHTSYLGTFTYQQRGGLKTFKVLHLVRDGKEYEKLIHLDGARMEVIRPGNPLHCKRAGRQLLDDTNGESRIDQLYHLKIVGQDRVADREVIEVHLQPRDGWRNGYLLAIDRQSGLLLRSLMIANDGRTILERFQFVDLRIEPDLSPQQLQSSEVEPLVADIETLPCDNLEPLAFGLW